MKKLLVLLIIISISVINKSYSQDKYDHLKKTAIEIANRTDTNSIVYNAIKSYKAILIGEIHGTIEPSEFLIGIAKTLADNGKNIIVGLEISKEDYEDIIEKKNIEELKDAKHFNTKFQDGRQSLAWAKMIIELKQHKNIKLIFFDLTSEEWKTNSENRDSLMYLNINEELKKYPNSHLITLSGNIHNRLKTFRKKKTLGLYLKNDENSYLKDEEILSLGHYFGKGTMMNLTSSDGFKIKETKGNSGALGTALNYQNFLYIYEKAEAKTYNGFLFSRTITAAKPLIQITNN